MFAKMVSTQARNSNVEINSHDAFKLFPHGFAEYVRSSRRIDGGWHLSITRHLQVWLCTTNILPTKKRKKCAKACNMLYEVDAFLRWPVKKSELEKFSILIDDLLSVLIEFSLPYVKCLCNSIKFHWPRHWVYCRLAMGCSAAEKSLERKLGETQKKCYRFTNGKGNIDDQIHKKDMRLWTLRDVLHAGGLPSMETHPSDDFLGTEPVKVPSLVGPKFIFQYGNDTCGKPIKGLENEVNRVLLNAVVRDVNNNGVLQWLPPIKVASAISLTLRNRLAPIQSKRRYIKKVFRATSKFHSKEVWDCVKVAAEGSDANVKLYFGRCLAFFCDIKGDHYVALRWFETCNGDNNVLDPIVQMPQLQLACSTKLSSYGVMPVSAILNGALLIPSSNKFYAMQSPREQRVYVKLNS